MGMLAVVAFLTVITSPLIHADPNANNATRPPQRPRTARRFIDPAAVISKSSTESSSSLLQRDDDYNTYLISKCEYAANVPWADPWPHDTKSKDVPIASPQPAVWAALNMDEWLTKTIDGCHSALTNYGDFPNALARLMLGELPRTPSRSSQIHKLRANLLYQ